MEQTINSTGPNMEMPKYRCHKEVWALKIVAINYGDGASLYFDPVAYGPIQVSKEYLTRHRPTAGGYFVVYADGYQSFSPAAAFEEGYTRI